MVVDAVICHWVTVVAPTEDVREGLGLSIRHLSAYFYDDDGLTASTQLEKLQRSFEVLAGLFNQFGLRKNTRNTVSMSCQSCHPPDRMSL